MEIGPITKRQCFPLSEYEKREKQFERKLCQTNGVVTRSVWIWFAVHHHVSRSYMETSIYHRLFPYLNIASQTLPYKGMSNPTAMASWWHVNFKRFVNDNTISISNNIHLTITGNYLYACTFIIYSKSSSNSLLLIDIWTVLSVICIKKTKYNCTIFLQGAFTLASL